MTHRLRPTALTVLHLFSFFLLQMILFVCVKSNIHKWQTEDIEKRTFNIGLSDLVQFLHGLNFVHFFLKTFLMDSLGISILFTFHSLHVFPSPLQDAPKYPQLIKNKTKQRNKTNKITWLLCPSHFSKTSSLVLVVLGAVVYHSVYTLVQPAPPLNVHCNESLI